MKRVLVLLLASGLPAAVSLGQTWPPGTVVLASPTLSEKWWMLCVVKEAPRKRSQPYVLNCASDPSKKEALRTVPARWIKAAPQPGPAPTPQDLFRF